MTDHEPAWLAHQRARWMREDAARWIRPDAARLLKPGTDPAIDALYHAETTVLLRAAKANGGSLASKNFEIYVDRDMCRSCDKILPLVTSEFGYPMVIFVNSRTGKKKTLFYGQWLD